MTRKYSDCLKSDNLQLSTPTPDTHPIPLIQLPQKVTLSPDLRESATALPYDSVIFSVLFAALLIIRLICSSRLSRVALALTATPFLALALLTLAGWAYLFTIVHRFDQSRFDDVMRLTKPVSARLHQLNTLTDGKLIWRDDAVSRVGSLGSANIISAALVKKDSVLAQQSAEWEWPTQTREGRQARVAAFLTMARAHSDQSEPSTALDFAKRAAVADQSSATAQEAVAIASVHAIVNALTRNDPDNANTIFDRINVRWNPNLRDHLAAMIARRKVFTELGKATPDLTAMLTAVERGRQRVQSKTMPLSLDCDCSKVNELLGAIALDKQQPKAALSYLEAAEQLVPDSPVTLELLPIAQIARGEQYLENKEFNEALKIFEQALKRIPAEHIASYARNGIVTVWLSLADEQLKKEEFEEALRLTRRAQEIDRSHRSLDCEAVIRITRAQQAMQTGEWAEAKKDLKSARRSRLYSKDAGFLLWRVETAPKRHASINGIQYVKLPTVTGEDVDASRFYFLNDGVRVGWASRSNPSRIVFTESPDSNEPKNLVSDADNDNYYEEVQEIQESDKSTVWIDADRDFSPDVKLSYDQYGRLISKKHLSGKILLIANSAVLGEIAGGWDIFDGKPDPFVSIYHNRQYVFKTSPCTDTTFPIWNEGIVIEFKYGDMITLNLWDDDPIEDDWVGSHTWHSLPESRQYKVSDGVRLPNAVVDVTVTPTKLPPGYRFKGVEIENAFKNGQFIEHDIREIVASARRMDARSELDNSIAQFVATELLVNLIAPRASLVAQLGLSFLIGNAISNI